MQKPIFKTVKPIGDGAHVILPKAWLGESVKVTIVKPVTDKEEVPVK
jgi:hypothetical protein